MELRQMSWLLKTVAIEMKVTGSNQQLSQLASIVEVYTGDQKQNEDDTIDQSFHSICKNTIFFSSYTTTTIINLFY